MESKITYKLFRRRLQHEWWTDITSHYDSTGGINELDVAEFKAKEYKAAHKSDKVKIVKITEEDIKEI